MTQNVDRSVPQAKLIIGDKELTTGSGGIYQHINPATGQHQADVPLAGKAETEQAVDAAQQAFQSWRRTPPTERRDLLLKLAQLVKDNAAEFQRLAGLETATPLATSAGGPALCEEWTRYYAGWADKLDGQLIGNYTDNELIYSVPEPYGVIGIIITWNGPLISLGMKVAPALAAGNTVVIKPAEQTPFVATLFGQLAKEAGFPPGVINVLPGSVESATTLIGHPLVKKVTFTGGPVTARKIMHQCADLLKPVVLELGGKSANIVFEDADLDAAAQLSAFWSVAILSGQGCELPTRLLVQESVYDEMVQKVVAMVKSFKVGDPFDPTAMMGPLINAEACDRVLGMIERAKAAGARLLTGGERLGGELSNGYYLSPAVFEVDDLNSELAQQEVFGPVLVIHKFKTEAEAIAIANGTNYGLGGYIQTNDLKRAHRVAAELQTGYVHLNGSRNIPACAPFGGLGVSGFGKEGGRQGIEEFVFYKTISLTQ